MKGISFDISGTLGVVCFKFFQKLLGPDSGSSRAQVKLGIELHAPEEEAVFDD